MEIKASEFELQGDVAKITFMVSVSREEVPELSKRVREYKKYNLLTKRSEPKSKQSVNYLWSKVCELADLETSIGAVVSKDEVFDRVLRDYGQSEIFEIEAKEIALSLKEIYRIVDIIGDKDGKIMVKCFRGLNRLDKEELKILIDGVKYEIGQINDK